MKNRLSTERMAPLNATQFLPLYCILLGTEEWKFFHGKHDKKRVALISVMLPPGRATSQFLGQFLIT